MEIKEFQEKSKRTLNRTLSERETISNMIFGINGEVGEVTDLLKKYLYHGHDLDKDHLKEELGDVMFYIVNLCNVMGYDMQDIMQGNVDKLAKRYKKEFTVEESRNREESRCEHEWVYYRDAINTLSTDCRRTCKKCGENQYIKNEF